MTQIIYEDGRLTILQAHDIIEFQVTDLDYESRQQLINSIENIGIFTCIIK